jgi:DNA-binding IclR family transcriptional regulator
MQEPEYPVNAVLTSLRILEFLAETGGSRIQAIADGIDVPKSTVFRHLKTLEAREFVECRDERYYAGGKFLQVSNRGGRWRTLYRKGKSAVDELAAETNERVVVGIEEHGQVAVIYYSEGTDAIGTDVDLGTRFSLHCTAIGKVILAHLPAHSREEIIENTDLARMTENTITDESRLRQELDEIRETGIAFDNKERLSGVRGVAAPILDHSTDTLLGGITVAGATTSLREDRFREQIPDLLQRASEKIEMNVRYK